MERTFEGEVKSVIIASITVFFFYFFLPFFLSLVRNIVMESSSVLIAACWALLFIGDSHADLVLVPSLETDHEFVGVFLFVQIFFFGVCLSVFVTKAFWKRFISHSSHHSLRDVRGLLAFSTSYLLFHFSLLSIDVGVWMSSGGLHRSVACVMVDVYVGRGWGLSV